MELAAVEDFKVQAGRGGPREGLEGAKLEPGLEVRVDSYHYAGLLREHAKHEVAVGAPGQRRFEGFRMFEGF